MASMPTAVEVAPVAAAPVPHWNWPGNGSSQVTWAMAFAEQRRAGGD
jgi:hypothetical protein